MINVKKSMGRYLIGAFLGLLVGALLYFVQPVQWQGQALVKIGQIFHNNSYASIEPLPTVIERIKSRSFIQAVAKRAKRNEILALLSVEEKAGMSIKPIRDSDSLIITIVGSSADLVQASIDSTVAELLSKHDAIVNSYGVDIRKDLSVLYSEIDGLKKRLSILMGSQIVSSQKPAEENELVTGLWVMLIQRDLEYKMNRSSLFREYLSSANIRPTYLVEPTFISERQIFSSLWRASLFGLLLGIFFSVILIQWKK